MSAALCYFVGMPKNKNAFIRYRIIDTALRNRHKRYPTKAELIEACSGLGSVSARTIDKDIYDMKFDEELGYFAPIEYDRRHHGYYYTDEHYSISNIPLKAEDLYALEFACSLLKQFEGIEPVRQFIQSVNKIEDFINMKRIAGDDLNEVIQTEKSLNAKGNEYLGVLLSAIKERKVLMIHYKRFGEQQAKSYTYHPCVLKEYRNRWYVTGRCPDNDRIITFALERLVDVIVTRSFFTAEQAFDARAYFKHSFGISVLSGYQPETVTLRFHPDEAPYIKSQPLHETQTIVQDDAQAFVITLDVIPSYELKAQINSYGDHVEVLTPPFLREQHINVLQSALRLYSPNGDETQTRRGK